MKRIFAFVLCWTMLLSQMAMVAEAVNIKEQSDILYLGENGTIVNDGGVVNMESPLGKPRSKELYSPSVPKLVPEALKNLGLMPKEESSGGVGVSVTDEDDYELNPEDIWVTYTGRFNKDRVLVYKYLGLDAESVWFDGTPDHDIELIETIDPTWYQLDCGFDGLEAEYTYVRAQDVDMAENPPVRGRTVTDDSGLMVRVEGVPTRNALRIASIPATGTPVYKFGKNDTGIRTLLASCSLSVRTTDGAEWQPDHTVEVFMTLPEIPELSERGSLYVLQEDSAGNITILHPTRYFLSNTISIETSELSNYYVYSVDYAKKNNFVELPPMGEETTLYHLYASLNSSKSFGNVRGIAFEKPEMVEVEPFFNEEIGMNDWRITVLTPNYIRLGFRVIYKGDSVKRTSKKAWGTLKGEYYYTCDPQISLGENLKYSIFGSQSTEGFAVRGTNTIRLGYASANTSEKVTLTFDGNSAHMYLDDASDVLNLMVNENCDGSALVRGTYTGDLVQVGGVLNIIGRETDDASNYLHLSGDDRTGKTRALVRVMDGGRVYAKTCYIEKAINTNSGGAVAVSENGYFRAMENVYIENNKAVKGSGGGLYSLGKVRLDSNVTVSGNTAGKDGGGIYSAGEFYGAELLITENEAKQNGGGISNDGGEISFAGVEISYNVALSGGGIHQSGGRIDFCDSNKTATRGSVEGKDAALRELLQYSSSVSIHGNTGKSRGGGLLLQDGMIGVLITNGTQINIYQNTASYGGGMFLGGTTATKTNVQLYRPSDGNGSFDVNRNTGTSNCGGVMMESCDLSVGVPMYIKHNTAQNCSGGGLFVGAGVAGYVYVVVSAYIEIGGNTATNGGGFYLGGGLIVINAGITMTISNKGQTTTEWDYLANKANQASKGAGMYISSGSFLNSGTLNIQSNTATSASEQGKGGGVYMSGGTFTNGGTLNIRSNTATSTHSGETNQGDGGGMYLAGGTFVTSTNALISSNQAHEGGGVFLNGGTFQTTGTARPQIHANTGINGVGAHHGGGMHAENGTITIDSTQEICIYENKGQYGAGLFFGQHGGTVTINGSRPAARSLIWPHENHVTDNLVCPGVFVEACTVNLYGKMLIERQVYGAQGNADGSDCGHSDGALKIQNFTDNGTAKAGILNVYGELEVLNSVGNVLSGGISVSSNGFLNVQSGGIVKVTGCSTASDGGGIFVSSGNVNSVGTLQVTNCSAGGSGGGIYSLNAPTFRIEGTDNAINGNTATGQGGAVWAHDQAAVTISNCTMDGNTAKNGHAGGIIFYRDDGSEGAMSLTDCNITNNKCLNQHGYGTNGDSYNNYDDDRGAGVYAGSVSLTISGGSISNNTTSYGRGGGVYFEAPGKELSITGCTIMGNEVHETNATNADKAGYGGGICVLGGSKATISGSDISGNIADDLGGGIYTSIPMSISDTVIGKEGAGNKTNSNHGGGIYAQKANVTITGGSVGYNTANSQGGGIYMFYADLTVDSGTDVHDNTATNGHGGGLYSFFGNITLGENTKVRNNQAYGAAGGIIIHNADAATKLTLSIGANSEISDNTAGIDHGGGIYANNVNVSLGEGVVISGNKTDMDGGGMYMVNTSFTMQDKSSIHHNEAGGNGGGIYYASGTITASGAIGIYANTATKSGGGIYSEVALTLNGNLTIGHETDATLGNTATTENGGGIYCKLDVSLTNVKVCNNTAGGNGGGICVVAGKNITLAGAGCVDGNSAGGNGGGVYISTGKIDTSGTSSMSFTGNYAQVCGGAILLNSATATLTNAVFTNNTAGWSGGAIYSEDTVLSLNSANSFEGNMAGTNKERTGVSETGGNGGAIYFTGTENTLTLDAVELKNNMARRVEANTNGHGGAIFVEYSSLTIKGAVKIYGNTAECNGGGISLFDVVFTSTADAEGVAPHIYNNTALNGGGILMGGSIAQDWSNHAITIGGGTEDAPLSNTATFGGGVYSDGLDLTIGSKVQILRNFADAYGGSIYIDNNGTVTTPTLTVQENTQICYNTTDKHGGGIFAHTCNVVLHKGVSIHHNEAAENGGGIYVYLGDLTIEEGVQIYENTAAGYGGGIFIYGEGITALANLTLGSEVEICDNRANEGHGGGIYARLSNVQMDAGVKILRNTAGGHGGGVFVYRTNNTEESVYLIPTVTLSGTTGTILIQDNSSGNQGGGMYVYGSHLIADNVNISNNTSAKMGGGVLMVSYETVSESTNLDLSAMQCEIKNSSISDNISGSNAGGIYAEGYGKLTFDNITVQNNKTTGYGGGLLLSMKTHVPVITNCTIDGNEATGNGGGIYMFNMKTAPTLTDSDFTNNKAGGNGGAIWISEASLTLDSTNTINNNYAGVAVEATRSATSSSTGGNGGGIFFNSTDETLTLDSATIEYNYAYASGETNGNGGGIYMKQGMLKLTGKTNYVQYNTAENGGGGLYMQQGNITMAMDKENDPNTGKEITYDFWIRNNTAKNGGGVFFGGTAGTIVLDVEADKRGRLFAKANNASANGAGVYISNCTVSGDSDEVETDNVEFKLERNVAKANGGGMFVGGDSHVTLKKVPWIYHNEAVNGGGIYLESGSLDLSSGGTLHSNIASANGGGIYTKADLTLGSNCRVGYLSGETELGNFAKNGGGIYVYSGNTTLKGASVLYNEAGVSVTATVDEADVWSIATKENVGGNGGGLYVNSGNVVLQSNAKIANNQANGTTDEEGNAVGGNGGGVCMRDGSLTLTEAAVDSNYAKFGGGLYIRLGSVTATGSSITGNTATLNGGGVWTNGGSVELRESSVIANNQAESFGGGIYARAPDSETEAASVTVTSSTIEGNTAKSDGGGIYITQDANSTVTLTDAVIRWNQAILHKNAEGNNTGGNGGGIRMNSGTVTLTGKTEVYSNYASFGGGVYVRGGELTMGSEVVVSDHCWTAATQETQMSNGGGIWMDGGKVTLTGTTIRDNHLATDGGGIRLKSGDLILEGAKIQGNTTVGRGAGIYMTGGTLTETGSSFTNNTAGRSGGGLYAENVNLTLENTVFDGNVANVGKDSDGTYHGGCGGGVFFADTTLNTVSEYTLTLDGVELKNNEAYCVKDGDDYVGGRGGGVAVENSHLVVKGAAYIHDNYAARNGGGIHILRKDNEGATVYPDITATMTGTAETHIRVEANTAGNQGGGVYVYGSCLDAEYVDVVSNIANHHGGGLLLVSYANKEAADEALDLAKMKCAFKNGSISHNISKNSAGGIYIEGYWNEESAITDTVVSDNKAVKDGGGIYIRNTELTLDGANDISGNYAGVTVNDSEEMEISTTGGRGGGVYVHADSTLTMNAGSVSRNHAKEYTQENGEAVAGYGGGIYVASGSAATIIGGEISGNHGSFGGGIHGINATLEISGGTIYVNTATTHGGGIYAKGGTLTYSGGSIYSNYANEFGGGMFLKNIAATISGGVSIYSNTAKLLGGGICYEAEAGNESSLTVENCDIYSNHSDDQGGGIHVVNATATISGGKIHGNTAANGGGVSGKDAEITISGSNIYNNMASTHGGGIYAKGGTIDLAAEIHDNGASRFGGGIFAKNIAVTLNGSGKIYENAAGEKGGGICLDCDTDSTASLTVTGFENATIYSNTAGIKTGEEANWDGKTANWDSAAGNDIYAVGKTTTVTISETTDADGVAQYWFADYAKGDTKYPGQKTFPSSYVGADGSKHLGRYNADVTPVSFARRSVGVEGETGWQEASTAFLALTLGTAKYINLNLTKELSDEVGAAENTTFIFYIKGVDNDSFLLPVAIHLQEGDLSDSVTIANLPLGFYDIYEDESWSWRYNPSDAAYGEESGVALLESANGDSYIRIQATIANSTSHGVRFTNGIENVLWLSDAKYLPFLAPASAASPASVGDDEEENE